MGSRRGIWTRHTVADEEGGRALQEILTGSIGISGRMIQRLTRSGGIQLNGRAAFLGRPVRPGDVVAVRIGQEEDPGLAPLPMDLSVLFEDEHLLVVDKPAGVLVHPVRAGGEATLAHGITHHLLAAGVRTRVRPVHRLDRDTSGLLLVAKHSFAHQALDRELRERRLRRIYLAFVQGADVPDQASIDAPIGPHPHDSNLRAVVRSGGDTAVTRYRVRERYPGAALLEVELETGRTHQIRVHLSHTGHPLLGDTRYGGSAHGLHRQALHATRLSFRHPLTGQSIELEAPLPADLEELRRELLGVGRGRRGTRAQG